MGNSSQSVQSQNFVDQDIGYNFEKISKLHSEVDSP